MKKPTYKFGGKQGKDQERKGYYFTLVMGNGHCNL